ncbi:MAG: MATE family efflux transporter [Caldilineaceae bacterium]
MGRIQGDVALPQPVTLNRTILQLALPAVVENLLQTLVFFADTVMVGWLRDPAALAAVGLGSSLFYLLMTLFSALAVSATAMVARAWGAGNRQRAVDVGGQALMITFVFSALGLAVIYPYAADYIRIMGGAPDVVSLGRRYTEIILYSSLLNYPMMVANGIMRGAGDTRTPMWNTLIMNVWNVMVSFVLIFGIAGLPALGIEGAAWGTSSAR